MIRVEGVTASNTRATPLAPTAASNASLIVSVGAATTAPDVRVMSREEYETAKWMATLPDDIKRRLEAELRTAKEDR